MKLPFLPGVTTVAFLTACSVIVGNAQAQVTPEAPATMAQATQMPGTGGMTGQGMQPGQPGQPGMMGPGMGQGQGMGRGMMGQGMSQGMAGQRRMGHGRPGHGRHARRRHIVKVMFAIADQNGDGALSFEEVAAIHQRIFNAVDVNNDGQVTIEEVQAFMPN